MNNLIKNINIFFYKLFSSLIFIYQKIISPITPARCRYYPTCSNYGKQALAWHGVWAGSWLLLKRIGRCQPWGGHGIDFVPLPLASYIYHYLPVTVTVTGSNANTATVATDRDNHVYRDNVSYGARLNHLLKP
jgi:putative membrane protein insertion efficiency factor